MNSVFVHEVKNTLQACSSQLDMAMAYAKKGKDPRRYLFNLRHALDHTLAMYQFFYGYSEDGSVFCPADAVRRVVTGMAPALLCNLVAEIDKEAENRTLDVSEGHFYICLSNLIHNAYQSLPYPESGYIEVCLMCDDDKVIVSVEDNGSGIEDKNIDKIFRKGFSTKKNGAGLGLWLVYQLAKAYGARVDLDTRVGRETKVSLVFPVQESFTNALYA